MTSKVSTKVGHQYGVWQAISDVATSSGVVSTYSAVIAAGGGLGEVAVGVMKIEV